MKTKKRLFTLLIATSALAVSGLTFALLREGPLTVKLFSDPTSYPTTLNSENRPAEMTASFQNNFAGDVKTGLGNDLNLSFTNARSSNGLFAELASHGKIYNFGEGNSEMRGLSGVTFDGQGTLQFKPVIKYGTKGAAIYPEIAPISIAAGAGKVTVPKCDYFEIEAGEQGAGIQSLTFTYSCEAQGILDIKMLNGSFTGIGEDDYTWKLTIQDGQVTIDRLDAETALSLTGTVEMLTKTRVKCTFVFMTMNVYYVMDYDGHSFTFVEKSDDMSGNVAKNVTTIEHLYRVYNVEDFESYSETGNGYYSDNATSKYLTSGLKAHYYGDTYKSGSSGEIGGNGWPVMDSTNFANNITLVANAGREGTKGGFFMGKYNTDCRYISMNELYGVKAMIGKGTKISFWTRGAYKVENSNYVNYSLDLPMKLYAYYTSPLTPSNQSSFRETFEFTCHHGNEWEKHVFDLNADGRNYYGFGIYIKNTVGSNTPYIPFDDIEIYTVDPHAEYSPSIPVESVALNKNSTSIAKGSTEQLTATVGPESATNKNVIWSSDTPVVATVSETGLVTAKGVGVATITAKTEDGGFKAYCEVTVTATEQKSYPEGTYCAVASILGHDYDVVLAIGNSTNGLISVQISNTDAKAKSISYDDTTKEITIVTEGSMEYNSSTYTYGNITGTYHPETDRIEDIGVDGTVSVAVTNNGHLVASRITLQYDCDGTNAELQAQFKRRFQRGNGWEVDSGNSDRFVADTSNKVSGTSAMKVRPFNNSSAVCWAFNFKFDFAQSKSVRNLGFWVYNPTETDIYFREFIYKGENFSSNAEMGWLTAKAGGWSYACMGFGTGESHTPVSIYNIQISVWRAGNNDIDPKLPANGDNVGVQLTFDNIVLF